MKSLNEIDKVLSSLPEIERTEYPAMTYEQGIEEALMWVIGDIDDEDFSYAPK